MARYLGCAKVQRMHMENAVCIPAGKEARPAIQPCDTLATLPSELFTPETGQPSPRGPFVFWTLCTQWAD